MFTKKKILISLASCLAILCFSVHYSYSENTKGGWDYLQAGDENKSEYVQQLPKGTKNITKKLYKQGDLEKGVLSLKSSFDIFPEEDTISITLRNADIKEVLRELARKGQKSIIIDNSVSGTISCELEDVSTNQAMDLVLATGELESRMIGDTIFIASRSAMLRKGLNRRAVKSFKLNHADALDVASILEASIFNNGLDVSTTISETTEEITGTANQATEEAASATTFTDNESVITDGVSNETAKPSAQTASAATGKVSSSGTRKVRVLEGKVDKASGYNDAKKLAGEVKIRGFSANSSTYDVANNSGGPIVVPDTRNNSLLIAGTEEDIYLAEQTIQNLDLPKKQVVIEASLIEMSRKDASAFGITLTGGAKVFNGGFNTPVELQSSGYTVTPNGYPAATGAYPYNPDKAYAPSNLAKTVGIITPAGMTNLQLSTIQNITNDIVAKIQAQVTKGKLKLIANPNVIVLDNSEALIKLTEQVINKISVTISSQTGTITRDPTLADIGIVLNVLPKVADDGSITMRIRPSVTTPGETVNLSEQGDQVTLINTREVIIQNVRVKTGETIAIGGLIRELSSSTVAKVPFLGDLPILGPLFRTRVASKEKTELVILITPKIVNDIAMKNSELMNGQTNIPID